MSFKNVTSEDLEITLRVLKHVGDHLLSLPLVSNFPKSSVFLANEGAKLEAAHKVLRDMFSDSPGSMSVSR